jgi:NAD(P)-dependent dehydrogenase (short-subunit alcohol dehydrogenase family)
MTSLDLFRLDGQVAVVVGGAGGLGAAIARGLAEAGAPVAVADANAAGAKTVADGIAAKGGRAQAVTVDVTDAASVERMAEEVESRLGPIEILVNSAGITHRAPAAEFPEAQWHRVIAVNLTGVYLASQAVGRRMVARRGVVQLTRGLAVEWAPHNVRVNAIAPSWFSTDIGDLIHREPGYEQRAMRRVPVGRMGRPDELVGAALYLASEASSMVTGHILAVDGGTLAS